MKKHIILNVLLIVFSLAGSLNALAQSAQRSFYGYEKSGLSSGSNEKSAGGLPGAKIVVERLRNSEHDFVSPDADFRPGDKIRFWAEINFDGYLTMINRSSPNAVTVMNLPNRRHQPASSVLMPGDGEWISPNDFTGEFAFIVSKTPMGYSTNAEIERLINSATGGGRL